MKDSRKPPKTKAEKKQENNPFLGPLDFGHGYGAIPFDKIRAEHFIPAIKIAIEEAKEKLKKIKENKEEPNFQNTIFAFETSSERLDIIFSIYDHLFDAEADKKLRALSKRIFAFRAKFCNSIYLNKKLFRKVEHVYNNRESLRLKGEQLRLTEFFYKAFERSGVLMGKEQKKKLRKINIELSKLTPDFANNVLNATNDFQLVIEDKSQLSGLPPTAIEAAADLAKKKGFKESTYVFTLQAPSYYPFMTFADSRELRKKMYLARASRACEGKFDNQKIVKKMAELRYNRAKLLGYKNHADYVLEERMAKNVKNVYTFLDKLRKSVFPAAKREYEELLKFAEKIYGLKVLRPWDLYYYEEKLKKKKFNFDEEELRPYFKLENVVDGIFLIAKKLYGLEFFEINAPVYNEEVGVYKVKDRKGKYLGLFYTDFHPRETKRDGAWASSYIDQGYFNGKVRRPHVGIHCNFTKSTSTKPSLLTFDEVLTFIHEFGHALHCLLSDCAYRSIGGFNVLWDFVELPSQIMENWLREKEALDLFAVHFETGEKIPSELVEKIKQAEKFMAGWSCLRQLKLVYLDMAWHTTHPLNVFDVAEFEKRILKPMKILASIPRNRKMPRTSISCSFSHIFGGGYSAGFYSYKWAEVLDADAFELFKEKGLFNPEVAGSFRKNILSRGNTVDPMELYKRFRGREPKIDALLRRYNIIK